MIKLTEESTALIQYFNATSNLAITSTIAVTDSQLILNYSNYIKTDAIFGAFGVSGMGAKIEISNCYANMEGYPYTLDYGFLNLLFGT